jgi:LSD1 subclass zinc finger protein
MSKRSATTRSRSESLSAPMPQQKKTRSGGGGERSKKSLDFLLFESTSNDNLLQGYSPDQLKELQDRLKDIQTELIRNLDYDNEIREVIGAKLDGKSMWFCVKWAGGETSFIPSNIINRIAPNKVIEYYEGIVSYVPHVTEEKELVKVKDEVVGLGNLNAFINSTGRNEPMIDSNVNRILERREILDRPVVQRDDRERNSGERENTNNSVNSFERPVASKPKSPAVVKTMHCTGCGIKLKFPGGTKLIKCPSCNHIMQTANI